MNSYLNKYITVPAALTTNRYLTLAEKVIYLYLKIFSENGEIINLLITDKIAALFSMNTADFCNHVKNLVLKGFLESKWDGIQMTFFISKSVRQTINNTPIIAGINVLGCGYLPKQIILDSELSIGAKALYAYYASLTRGSNSCFPLQSCILVDLNIEDYEFKKYRRELVDRGLIHVYQLAYGVNRGRNAIVLNDLPKSEYDSHKENDLCGIFGTQELTIQKLKRTDNAVAYVSEIFDYHFVTDQQKMMFLNDLIYSLESCALSARRTIGMLELDEKGHFKIDEPSCLEDLPCQVLYDGDSLIVKTPLTVKRGLKKSSLKKNYQIFEYVYAAIKKWKKENPTIDLCTNPNFTNEILVLIIKRKAIKYSASHHCNNDHIENHTIQNVICASLGIQDHCNKVDNYLCFRQVDSAEDIGMEFILTPSKNLLKYIES